ncbi:MAG TPA: DNA-directed RNA polymerase [Rhodopseudomonas sp.]|uniref:DNA-directed RNA polymerase n=1 Tax=Rhodopseudomonas sp. TaxID=1078 RepID=UPI002EDB4BB2
MLSTQIILEEGMALDAKVRQTRDNQKKGKLGVWSETKTGVLYQRSLDAAFAKIVGDKLNGADPHKPGPKAKGVSLLLKTGLEPEVIAHLFVKAFLNCIPRQRGKRIKRSSICIKVGDLIHDEVRIRHFGQEKERRNLLKKLCKQFDRRSYPRDWRKRTIKNYFDAEHISWTAWDDGQKTQVGYALLLWFRDGTGLVEAPSDSIYVDPTEEFIAHMETMMEKRVLDYLIYKPMVVKPIPWSMENLFRGGYTTNKLKAYPLVKRTGRGEVDEMLKLDWSQIIPAVNALQETPFKINKTILSVLDWAYNERGGDIAGLPRADDQPLPPAPEGYREDEKITKAHNLKCFLIRSANRELKSKRRAVTDCISIAKKYKEFPAIYFPHNLDSRGRAYPITAYLNPQGTDFVKALLEFGEGHPIMNEEQACWLAIACANAYGNDKVSLQERADWTTDNEDMIFSIATDPLMDIRWTEASEPFQFLRACIEWRDFMNTGFGFVSHLVIPVDATCSGLQHYSAMLLDEQGGRAVTREDWANLSWKSESALMTGGGIGSDYSVYRGEGAPLGRTGGLASGPIPKMLMVNEIGRRVMQGGSRRSAIYASLNWKHSDVRTFLTAKDWKNMPVGTSGLTYWDIKQQDFNFPAPLDMTNISVNYDTEWLTNFWKTGDVGDVFLTNVRQALETAEPGFSFNFFDKERETLRNACTEVTSEDDSDVCNLGSLNLGRIDTIEELQDITALGTMFLLCGTLKAQLPYQKVYDVRAKNRRLGLGLMGIHEWLIKRGQKYEVTEELHRWLAAYRGTSDSTSAGFANYLGVSTPVANRAIAPTGTIGILAGTTSGIEPLFAVAYKRRYLKGTKWHYQYVVDSAAQELINVYGVSPDMRR